MIIDLNLPQWASLLNCPFCGGKAELSPDGDGVFAGCKSKICAINPITDTYKTKREAIRAWNRRPA
ncbi:Lar family restriction alleviation protein [Citrobacter freundii]|uniref:Lar family restriction alleviation protein n=1 Tax=Citrobacter freundii TaxID=546 RepID=UPI001925837D